MLPHGGRRAPISMAAMEDDDDLELGCAVEEEEITLPASTGATAVITDNPLSQASAWAARTPAEMATPSERAGAAEAAVSATSSNSIKARTLLSMRCQSASRGISPASGPAEGSCGGSVVAGQLLMTVGAPSWIEEPGNEQRSLMCRVHCHWGGGSGWLTECDAAGDWMCVDLGLCHNWLGRRDVGANNVYRDTYFMARTDLSVFAKLKKV
jgi:hypothetical protein